MKLALLLVLLFCFVAVCAANGCVRTDETNAGTMGGPVAATLADSENDALEQSYDEDVEDEEVLSAMVDAAEGEDEEAEQTLANAIVKTDLVNLYPTVGSLQPYMFKLSSDLISLWKVTPTYQNVIQAKSSALSLEFPHVQSLLNNYVLNKTATQRSCTYTCDHTEEFFRGCNCKVVITYTAHFERCPNLVAEVTNGDLSIARDWCAQSTKKVCSCPDMAALTVTRNLEVLQTLVVNNVYNLRYTERLFSAVTSALQSAPQNVVSTWAAHDSLVKAGILNKATLFEKLGIKDHFAASQLIGVVNPTNPANPVVPSSQNLVGTTKNIPQPPAPQQKLTGSVSKQLNTKLNTKLNTRGMRVLDHDEQEEEMVDEE